MGTQIVSGPDAPIEVGNALPLSNIPLGTTVHNVELNPGRGGQIVRAAGTSAQLVAKEGNFVTLKLPSTEVRMVRRECYATIGQVGNADARNLTLGKAGRTRWKGRRPQVRGSVMNPVDHPHGGGEGRAPIGRSGPVTPWGKPTLGMKTRKKKQTKQQIRGASSPQNLQTEPGRTRELTCFCVFVKPVWVSFVLLLDRSCSPLPVCNTYESIAKKGPLHRR